MVDLQEALRKLAFEGVTYMKEIAPGVHGYGSVQAVGRVRAYQSASLQPFAANRPMREVLLIGHAHVADGKVTRLEGFNGQEGQRWCEKAKPEAEKLGILAPGAIVNPTTPLRDCPHARGR